MRWSRKVNAFTLVNVHKGWQYFLELSLFLGVNLWIAEVLLYALPVSFRLFPWPFAISLIDSSAARVAGVVHVFSGFAFFILGLMALGSSWRLGIDEKAPGTLVTRGIYNFSRNPIYGFFDLYLLGTFFINGKLIFLVFALLVAVNLHYQIIGEEKFLRQIYGKLYQEYLTSTSRYFPWHKLTGWLTRRSPEAAEI